MFKLLCVRKASMCQTHIKALEGKRRMLTYAKDSGDSVDLMRSVEFEERWESGHAYIFKDKAICEAEAIFHPRQLSSRLRHSMLQPDERCIIKKQG